VLFVAACQSERQQKQPEGNAMSAFVDDYFKAFFDWNPTYGTSIGFHEYDSKLEDFSAAAFSGRIEKLRDLRGQLDGIPPASLSVDEQIDAAIAKTGPGNLEKLMNSGETWVVE